MRAATLLLGLVVGLYGCGDSGPGGGEGDDSSDDGGETSGSFPDDDGSSDGDDDGDPIDPGDDDGSSGDDGSSSTTGGDPGDQGTTCQQIWDCYQGCEDTDCTIACHEAGSVAAQEQDNALWECIFVEHCGSVDWDCVQEHCAAEQQACLG